MRGIHLYAAGVEEGAVVILQGLLCITLGREAYESELPRLAIFGAHNFRI